MHVLFYGLAALLCAASVVFAVVTQQPLWIGIGIGGSAWWLAEGRKIDLLGQIREEQRLTRLQQPRQSDARYNRKRRTPQGNRYIAATDEELPPGLE